MHKWGFFPFLALFVALQPSLAWTMPDFRGAELVEGLTVYPDSQHSKRYYHTPGLVRLATADDGRPLLQLLSTRYQGTAAAGDQGRQEQRHLLTFQVIRELPDSEHLGAVRAALTNRHGAPVELRPLPVMRMPNQLMFVPADAAHEQSRMLGSASLEGESGLHEGYWSERSYGVSLSPADAELMHQAIDRGGLLLTLAYGFIVSGLGLDVPLHELTGSPELVELAEEALEAEADPVAGIHLIGADATSIRVDSERWPQLVQRVDINERLPPGFGVLEVRCYDFQRDDQPDLFETRVDIRAETVSGSRIVQSVYFSAAQAERFSAQVRFPVAVRLDRPFQYRVGRVYLDGSEILDEEWTRRERWTAMIDATAPATDTFHSTSTENHP